MENMNDYGYCNFYTLIKANRSLVSSEQIVSAETGFGKNGEANDNYFPIRPLRKIWDGWVLSK